MSDLAVQNRESEQEVMPSFDFLLEMLMYGKEASNRKQ